MNAGVNEMYSTYKSRRDHDYADDESQAEEIPSNDVVQEDERTPDEVKSGLYPNKFFYN